MRRSSLLIAAIALGFGLLAYSSRDLLTVMAARSRVQAGEFGGPVRASEVPALARASGHWLPSARHAAARLLILAPGADEAQADVAMASEDPLVWGPVFLHLAQTKPKLAAEVSATRGSETKTWAQHTSPEVRAAALHSYRWTADAGACLSALEDPAPAAREAAARCLAHHGDAQTLNALAAQARAERDARALLAMADALLALDTPESQAHLLALLRRCDEEALIPGGVGPIIDAMGASGAPHTSAALVELAAAPSALRLHALRALSRHPRTNDVAALCSLILEAPTSEPPDLRAQAERSACRAIQAGDVQPPTERDGAHHVGPTRRDLP